MKTLVSALLLLAAPSHAALDFAEKIPPARAACAKLDADGCATLGGLELELGDTETAKLSYRKACEWGHARACRFLGRLALGQHEWLAANRLLQRGCRLGNPEACADRGQVGDLAVEPLAPEDPFAGVRTHRFANGLTVVTNLDAREPRAAMRVVVDAGSERDGDATPGLAHLVEHARFHDPELLPAKSLIDLPLSDFNAATTRTRTRYQASYGADKVETLVEILSLVLRPRPVTASALAEAKREVLAQLAESDGSFLFEKIAYAWREFGVPPRSGANATERRALARLGEREVDAFVDRYYYPGNMVVYLGGGADETAALDAVRRTFGSWPGRGGRVQPVEPKPVPRPHVTEWVTRDEPTLEIGTKFHDLDAEDEVALRVFTHYFARRVPDLVRSARATESGLDEAGEGFGRATTVFTAPARDVAATLAAADGIFAMARTDTWSDAQIRRAFARYAETFDRESDPAKFVDTAYELHRFRQIHATDRTPRDAFLALTPQSFATRLRRLLAPERSYRIVLRDLFFRYDFVVTVSAGMLLAFLFALRRSELRSRSVAYVHPVRVGHLALGALGLLVAAFYLEFAVLEALARWWSGEGAVTRIHVVVFFSGILTGAILLVYPSRRPRELLVSEGKLVLKWFWAGSRAFPLADIASFAAERRRLRPGVVVRFKDGGLRHLPCAEPEAVAAELETLRRAAAAVAAVPAA